MDGSLFSIAMYSDRFRNFALRTKLKNHHLIAIVGFLSIPLFSLIENKTVRFSLSMISFILVSGYFMSATLTIMAAEFCN